MTAYLHPLILLNGMEASGKSTLKGILADRLGALGMESPGPYGRRISIDEPLRRYQEYAQANILLSDDIRLELETRPVVLVRYFLTTAAGHEPLLETGWGTLRLPKGATHRLLLPSAAITLVTDEETNRRRLTERGERLDGHNDYRYQRRVVDSILKYQERLGIPWTMIDTSDGSEGIGRMAADACGFLEGIAMEGRTPVPLSTIEELARRGFPNDDAPESATAAGERFFSPEGLSGEKRESIKTPTDAPR